MLPHERSGKPRQPYLSRALLGLLVTAAWIALPLALLAIAHALTARDTARISAATLTTPAGSARAVTLPYTSRHEPSRALYAYRVTFEMNAPRAALRIVPDDCVRSLLVNGAPVDLSRFGPSKLCDFRGGFTVDVSSHVKAGANVVEVTVENLEGPHGLAIEMIPGAASREWLAWLVLVLLVAACAPAVRSVMARREPPSVLSWAAAAVLVALAGWIRYRFVFEWHPPNNHVFSDMANYVERARQLRQGYTDEYQSFQPLGYPLILAASLKFAGNASLTYWTHVACGWATVGLVWRATSRWLGERAGLFALALSALHYPFISLSGFFLAETVFTFQLAALAYLLVRCAFPWRAPVAFAIGFVFMSALWIKGNNTVFGPLAVAWLCAWGWRRSRGAGSLAHRARRAVRRVMVPVSAFVAGAAVVVASHAAATHALYGHAQMSASTAALNFVEGKCPEKENSDSNGSTWLSPLFVQLGERGVHHWPRPFTDQGYFWAAGWRCVRNDPTVIVTSFRYVYYLFFDNQLWPSNTDALAGLNRTAGMVFSALVFPGTLIGALLLARRPWRRSTLYALIGVSILVSSWFFKSELRYRVPFDVVFIPVAVLGWRWLLVRLFRRPTKDDCR
jgi:hypothetical protein